MEESPKTIVVPEILALFQEAAELPGDTALRLRSFEGEVADYMTPVGELSEDLLRLTALLLLKRYEAEQLVLKIQLLKTSLDLPSIFFVAVSTI
ncbi:hypothetical protein COY93_00450 [Candidatus Uhrbacteria bacterium CG_4_10_14_0_8_um_filter_58_22]|uniref:Uncharacterized protein n=1 Tax=Candidatus Uhrbacteria bacterium CG_4_10_14_0_8_um_filter_58_22 TaxID=1975029 RepID=A0A2M7QB22_9BACT|nr:MAG: hypothetical protein AUJ19_04965 [Parcubacteria group bacterium CG1_02_58_44]PIY63349.1 MAG: hypothetical protein COY93_00450 [Candidatus Uhrbacteria bacterium CG_4_10_14_0_8_um_filter_58_22]